MNILDEIIAHKKALVKRNRVLVPMESFINEPFFNRKTISLKKALIDSNPFGIIAEFKRKSPSKGIINEAVDLVETTSGYQKSGAIAVSILTDNKFFGGKDKDLTTAREHLNIPILRKDFIVDEYQVYETKALGADVMLLIASCLSVTKQMKLAKLAHDIGLEVLFEIHSVDELSTDMIPYIDILGVNNRNLKTFKTSIQNSIDMFDELPDSLVKISESGISDKSDINVLTKVGFKGFLIGEQFMKYQNPALELEKFLR